MVFEASLKITVLWPCQTGNDKHHVRIADMYQVHIMIPVPCYGFCTDTSHHITEAGYITNPIFK